MAKLFANSGDPNQMPHSVASDLGLHCLPVTLLRVSRLQWVKPQWFDIGLTRMLGNKQCTSNLQVNTILEFSLFTVIIPIYIHCLDLIC